MKPTAVEIIAEVTEVTVEASLTLINVNMGNTDEEEVVDTLKPVLMEVVSNALTESQVLIEVEITAINGQQINSVRRLQQAQEVGVLRADFLTVVEETETCAAHDGECDGDVGQPDQEVGDSSKSFTEIDICHFHSLTCSTQILLSLVLSRVTDSIGNSMENKTNEGFLGRVRHQSQSRGIAAVFENSSVNSIEFKEEVSVTSRILTTAGSLVGFGFNDNESCRCYYERAVNVDGLERRGGRGPVAGQAESGSSWTCFRRLVSSFDFVARCCSSMS